MVTVEQIRKKMRISHTFMDDDIADNIKAALIDMSRVGVEVASENALVEKAIELYCKAQFDYMGKGEQHLKNYEKLRDSLSMAEKYKCVMN